MAKKDRIQAIKDGTYNPKDYQDEQTNNIIDSIKNGTYGRTNNTNDIAPVVRKNNSSFISEAILKANQNMNNMTLAPIEKPLIKSKNTINLTNDQIQNLSQRDKETTNRIINSLPVSNTTKNKVNVQVNNARRSNENIEKANKINEDLESGKYGSAIGHVLSGVPTEAMNSIVNTGTMLASLNPQTRDSENFVNTSKSLTSRYNETNSMINNKIVNTAGRISGTIGNMAPAIATSILTGGASLGAVEASNLVQGINVMSSEYLDTLNEQQNNKLKSFFTGLAKGGVSMAVEKLTGSDKIARKGSLDDIVKNKIAQSTLSNGKKWLASKAYEFGGEIAEENLENLAGYLIDYTINQKKTSLKDVLNDAKQTSTDTFWTTLVLNALGLGGNTYKEIKQQQNVRSELIDNSNLNENTKQQLKQLAEKNNWQPEVLQNMLEQGGNLNNGQNRNSQIENKTVLQNNQQTIQNNNKMAQNGNAEQIKQDSESFAKQVDNIENIKENNDLVVLNKTPKLYLELGANDKPMTITKNHTVWAMTEKDENNSHLHGLSKEIIKQIPEALTRPLNIVKSGSKTDSIVAITELADKDGNLVIVPIKIINGKGNVNKIEIDANVLTSIYGKDNDYDTWMKNNIKNERVLYDIDEGIIKKFRDNPPRLQLSNDIIPNDETSSFINNIIPQNENKMQVQEEKNIDKYYKYKKNIIKANEERINNLIQYKNETIKGIDEQIAEKEQELKNKKNQNTKLVNNIKMQIENLKVRKNQIENLYNEKIDKFNEKIPNEKIEAEVRNKIGRETKEKIIQEIQPIIKNASNWKDKKAGILYERETAQRNIQDIVKNKEEAEVVNKIIFDPVQKNQATAVRETNELFQVIKSLNLDENTKYKYSEDMNKKAPSKNTKTFEVDEATLAQLLIEKKLTEKDLRDRYKLNDETINKIKNTSDTFKNILDILYDRMNEVVIKYGYAPIGKIENYFPHFTENKPESIIGKIASKFGIDTTNQELPTEIAGKTDTFKPGKTWNSNLMERKSTKTDYDALKAMEKYIVGAMDIIHTTEDIQRVREFSKQLRYNFSEKGIQERIDNINKSEDLMPFEKEEAISAILNNKSNETHQLSHFVTWLDDYANHLANKKSFADRNMEREFGRNMYTSMSAIESRIAGNVIGGNLSVSLTNFAPLFQACGTTKVGNILTGLVETTSNDIKSFTNEEDNFILKSDFLQNRFGIDKISKSTAVEKASNIVSKPIEAVDAFVSETIVRAKYRENLQNGMSEEIAMQEADKYAGKLMADRSKGAIPLVFDKKNPLSKMITMFQVEPNNMISNYFKDMPREAKSSKQLAYQSAKLMASSWLFNTVIMAIRGGNEVLPDPIRFVCYLTKWLFSDDGDEKEQAQSDMLEAIVGATPFISNIAGLFGMEDVGRIPISNAMPDLTKLSSLADDEISNEYKKEVLMKEISKPLLYLGMPFGGAQLNKSIQGIATMIAGGSYKTNKKGEKELQFPVEKNVGNTIKAVAFGKYSLPIASQYINNGFKSLNSDATKLYTETGIDYNVLNDYINYSSESTMKDKNGYSQYTDKDNNTYWFDKETQTLYDSNYNKSSKNIKDLDKCKKKEDLVQYVNNLDISTDQKMALYKYNIISSTVSDDGTSAMSDMEYMLKNGMTEEEYMSAYTKAIENGISFIDDKDYDEIKNSGLDVNKYFDYKIDVNNATKEKRVTEKDNELNLTNVEKIKIVQSNKYSTKERDSIYTNYIMDKFKDNEEQTQYEKLKDYYSKNNNKSYEIIDQYLDYKVKANNKLEQLKASGEKEKNQNLSTTEKIQVLKNANYNSDKTEALFVNVIASESDSNKYEILKSINKGKNSINAYMTYKLSDISADKEDDGTYSGKSISGTAKTNTFNVVNSLNLSRLAKIYLYGTTQNLTAKKETSNYNELYSYLKTLNKSEQLKIVKTLKGATKMKDGSYSW